MECNLLHGVRAGISPTHPFQQERTVSMETLNPPRSKFPSNLRELVTRFASGASQRVARLTGPTRVGQLMTREPRSCGLDDPLKRAAQLMWDADCGAVPVVDADGRPVAMITDRDICMAAYTQGKSLGELSVSSAASRGLVIVRDDERLDVAEKLMQDHRIRRLIVVDAGGRLAGVLSLGDIARTARFPHRGDRLGAYGLARTLAAISQPAARAD
jgi:CBS domain-containing protein